MHTLISHGICVCVCLHKVRGVNVYGVNCDVCMCIRNTNFILIINFIRGSFLANFGELKMVPKI